MRPEPSATSGSAADGRMRELAQRAGTAAPSAPRRVRRRGDARVVRPRSRWLSGYGPRSSSRTQRQPRGARPASIDVRRIGLSSMPRWAKLRHEALARAGAHRRDRRAYQHYQFARPRGRAGVATTHEPAAHRRTGPRFPTSRRPPVRGQRQAPVPARASIAAARRHLGYRVAWRSVTHVMACRWTQRHGAGTRSGSVGRVRGAVPGPLDVRGEPVARAVTSPGVGADERAYHR